MYRSVMRPLINDFQPFYSAFLTYNGSVSRNWAGADTSDVTGCACVLLGSCPDGKTCRSDSSSGEVVDESGIVTNLQKLPLTGIVSHGIGAQSSANITIGSLGCAPKPFGESVLQIIFIKSICWRSHFCSFITRKLVELFKKWDKIEWFIRNNRKQNRSFKIITAQLHTRTNSNLQW